MLESKLRSVGEPADIYVLDVSHEDRFEPAPGSPWWCVALTLGQFVAADGCPTWEKAKEFARAARTAGKRVALIGVPVRSIPSEDHSLFDRFVY